MKFGILGPLEVREGDRKVQLRGGKERALLALLLLNANRTLALGRIVDELWGEDVPETAQKMVQIYVSHLRKALPPELIHTRPPGYALVIEPGDLDLHRFEQLVAEARKALEDGRVGAAAETFRVALQLWRGAALEEFRSEPFAAPEAGRLEGLRMNAVEGRVEADLQLGRHGDVIGELEALIARYPLREQLRQQHMLALYRAGRQAEALAAYQEARHALAHELGIEPSPGLRDLERRILQQDPALDLAATPSAASEAPPEPAAEPADAAPEEMLKLVTVLFADVVGSTGLVEAQHPEDVRALMSDFFSAMSAVIEEEGGTIEKFVGDAIMAVFGVPTVHEDDAVRAVRAACRMLGRLRRWNEERDAAEALEIRIGVCTGEVLAAGAAGDDLRVTGEAVNSAARLQQAAEPGAILVADRTARFARSSFELRALDGPLALRGQSEPLVAWRVVAPRRGEEPDDPAAIAAPLVGRDNELASLRTTFDRVVEERRPSLVSIVGDAGIGKSRLLREFLTPLQGEAKVLIGRCLPYGEGVTLWPLAEMLKAEAHVLETDAADQASAKIAKLVETKVDPGMTDDPRRTAAALASTLGLRPHGPPESLDPREAYRELVEAWRALIASLGRSFPVIAIVEDLHWADPTMLDVLEELAERLEGPILFLCTTRPDLLRSRPGWGGGRRNFSSLPLDPLSSEESARLASLLPGVDQLPALVRRRILERSEGNPFFLEEIIRHLVNEGLLVQEGERWRSSAGIDEVEIPDNVQAVILARLELLSPEERRAAQRAAVVGRVFWDGALARLADFDDLDAALRTLSRREFVLERLSSSIPGQREYLFKHVLIRDVAYASLPRAERGPAHAGTAAWIEEMSGDRADELAELLGHHYDAAFTLTGDETFRRAARTYLMTAASNAHRRFAIQQVERLARRAVELSEGVHERVEALESLGDLHYLAFLGDAAWQTYGEALAELADDDPAVARLAGKATLFSARFVGSMHHVPEVDAVQRMIERGLAAAPAPGRDQALLLVNRGFLIVQRQDRRDEVADAAVQDAEAAATALGEVELLSACFDLMQTHLELNGRRGEAYRTTLRRLELVPRLTDVKEIGDTYATAARSAFFLGRYGEAEAHADACIERARGVDSGSYIHGLTWRVSTHFGAGRWEAALADQAELERIVALGRSELPPAFALGGYARVALCHALRGEEAEADRYIELVLRYVALGGIARVRGRSIHLPPLALALARRGRLDEATDVLALAPQTASAGMTLEALCELAALRGTWDEAAALVADARAEAEVGEQLTLPLFADRLEGRTAAAAGDAAAAAVLLARSADGFAALGASWEEAWSRHLLAEVVAGDDDRRAEEEAVQALRVFDELGSVREAERACAVLASLVVP